MDMQRGGVVAQQLTVLRSVLLSPRRWSRGEDPVLQEMEAARDQLKKCSAGDVIWHER
jgi:hypothetical protein